MFEFPTFVHSPVLSSMGATWALFLLLALPWGHQLWQEASGILEPLWADNPDPDMVPMTDAEKAHLKDFVTRVQQAKGEIDGKGKGKDAKEKIFNCRGTTSAADMRSKQLIQLWQRRMMMRNEWRVTRFMHELLADRGLDLWGYMQDLPDHRDFKGVSLTNGDILVY